MTAKVNVEPVTHNKPQKHAERRVIPRRQQLDDCSMSYPFASLIYFIVSMFPFTLVVAYSIQNYTTVLFCCFFLCTTSHLRLLVVSLTVHCRHLVSLIVQIGSVLSWFSLSRTTIPSDKTTPCCWSVSILVYRTPLRTLSFKARARRKRTVRTL